MHYINVREVKVLRGAGPDRLIFQTTLPEGSYPYDGEATLTQHIAAGSAESYLSAHFPGLMYTVIYV